jgi:hypothetical protein
MNKIFGYFLTILLLSLALILINSAIKPHAFQKKVLSTSSIPTPENLNSKCHARYIDSDDPQAVLPDTNCTPGAINTEVTQDNLFQTICKSGYTKTIRPPVSYTNKLKIQQIVDYGYIDTNLKDYEEDHLISLELGGDSSSPKNLWPEPHGSPNEKDLAENYLNRQICDGLITLEQAQKDISGNWYEIYLQIAH